MPDLNDRLHSQFLRLLVENESAIRTFVRSLVPSQEDASEVVQEVTILLWQKFGEFDERRDFRKWAFGFARYQALAFIRDRARDRLVFDDDLVLKLADDAEAADERHDVQRIALEKCLLKLSEPQRVLTLLAYSNGIHINDLAAQRGQTPMSLYKLLHRIRRTLMECVRKTAAREELA